MRTFKELEARYKTIEREHDPTLDTPFAVIRVEGRGLRRLLGRPDYPFSDRFNQAMDAAALAAAQSCGDTRLVVAVAGEITVIIGRAQSYSFIGSAVRLAVAVTSAVSGAFNAVLPPTDPTRPAMFDGHIIPMSGMADMRDYVTWRGIEATTRIIEEACLNVKPQTELDGLDTAARFRLLAGTRFETIDDDVLHGRLLKPVFRMSVMNGMPARRRDWVKETALKENMDAALDALAGREVG